MAKPEYDSLDKVRQQFDSVPYPRIPLDQSPETDLDILFIHSISTPYYLRNQKFINSEGRVILDAGCGTGYKALALAKANPGAKVVGIDFSEESVKLARERLKYHGFSEFAEFYAISIYDVDELNIEFDYINADEVLYLLPDIVKGFAALGSVLKPDGIIRGNLHSYFQRQPYYRAQKLFDMMGLMNDNPGEVEIDIAREFINSLKDDVRLKGSTWNPDVSNAADWLVSNYLLLQDKGYTVPEMFSALSAAKLEFISMVNWREWDLLQLFKEPDNLPAFLAMSMPEISIEERLQMFELLHPVKRLMDFWCGHPHQGQPFVPVADWTDSDWQAARVHLHPQLRSAKVKEDLIAAIVQHRPWQIGQYLQKTSIFVDSSIGSCLLPLWEGPRSVRALVDRWLQVRSVDPVTLEPVSPTTAFQEVAAMLEKLETFLYVLLEDS
ncbi:bifunctional 2-polyprenyl-6-hydroxyphenol methylase/3-demethylubiquinol 3-O-methyltransferase UbiG [[Phormidium] sp. ETS-05]|uniref:class I SAM-dependent methyltransferase n=1 Tax=[Phormidium] sp. ETS-05 TaxID=222819 RepID=UPI0018EF1731|nr:methyltransferase domain-containing protein [[Phormidium] sp. ETS-05]